MNFSKKLKEIRKKEGISQEQLAERIGVSRQAITKWETGKGLPDVENMVIIAEIFKTTIDELLMDSMFKIKLDDRKNKLDVICLNKNKLSRYEAEESLTVEIILPNKYSDICEIAASVKLLTINNLHLNRLEYDGDAEQVLISDSSGSMELTAKTDYDITVDKITGRLDINQWKAKAIVHIPEGNIVNVINKGRKCNVYYVKEGKAAEHENVADSENEISISGIFSELVVDLLRETK